MQTALVIGKGYGDMDSLVYSFGIRTGVDTFKKASRASAVALQMPGIPQHGSRRTTCGNSDGVGNFFTELVLCKSSSIWQNSM